MSHQRERNVHAITRREVGEATSGRVFVELWWLFGPADHNSTRLDYYDTCKFYYDFLRAPAREKNRPKSKIFARGTNYARFSRVNCPRGDKFLKYEIYFLTFS